MFIQSTIDGKNANKEWSFYIGDGKTSEKQRNHLPHLHKFENWIVKLYNLQTVNIYLLDFNFKTTSQISLNGTKLQFYINQQKLCYKRLAIQFNQFPFFKRDLVFSDIINLTVHRKLCYRLALSKDRGSYRRNICKTRLNHQYIFRVFDMGVNIQVKYWFSQKIDCIFQA